VLALCLFADCTDFKCDGILAAALAEIISTVRDASTQWLLFGCAGMYSVGFGVHSRRLAAAPFWILLEVGRDD